MGAEGAGGRWANFGEHQMHSDSRKSSLWNSILKIFAAARQLSIEIDKQCRERTVAWGRRRRDPPPHGEAFCLCEGEGFI